MSAIITTDAIVLQTRRYSESSKIAVLYTRDHGKISVIARGAMRPKSSFGWNLQPMAIIAATLYFREGHELHTISAAEMRHRYTRLASNLDTMSVGMMIIELISAVMHDAEKSEAMYAMLESTLTSLDRTESSPPTVLAWFTVSLCEHLGYQLSADSCVVCGKSIHGASSSVSLAMDVGGPLCEDHSRDSQWKLSPRAFELLSKLVVARSAEELSGYVGFQDVLPELNGILGTYLQFHVQGLRKLKSRDVSRQLL